jgi:LacI family transcriptional regulator
MASVEQYPYVQGQKATEILLDLISKNKEGKEQEVTYQKTIVESKLVIH